MIDENKLNALHKIYTGLAGHHITWAVTGSLGLALQGIDVEVHDIDIQTSQAGAYAIEDCFQELVVTPVRYLPSARKRSYLGALEIEKVKVEIIGDVQTSADGETWDEPVNVEQHRRWVSLAGMQVPVISLEHEYHAYQLMGRYERAQQILQWLEEHPGIA